jgi:hypothetical protein
LVINRLLGKHHLLLISIAGASVLIACGGDGDGRARGTLAPRAAVAHAGPDIAEPTDGEARVVSRTDTEGVIALKGGQATSERHADELMTAHCGARGHTVTQEGIEALLPPGMSNEAVKPDAGPTKTEWHLHYKCGT